MTSPLRVFNYGGGVQSNAALVLAAQGKIDFQLFIFANVGNDSENPATMDYIERVARPYAAAHGIELVEVQKTNRAGVKETIHGNLFAKEFVNIPMYIPTRANANKGAPIRRVCTSNFKVRAIERYVKQRTGINETLRRERKEKARGPRPLVVNGFGISLDEWHRMRKPDYEWQAFEYPLIDMKIDREGCFKIIADAGLPTPPKSACWFCPFHSKEEWQRIRRETPALFDQAIQLEHDVQAMRTRQGKPMLWLTNKVAPLAEVIPAETPLPVDLDEEQRCDSGYCFV